MAYIEAGTCRLVSKNGIALKPFGDLCSGISGVVPGSAVLDGEVVCLDADLVETASLVFSGAVLGEPTLIRILRGPVVTLKPDNLRALTKEAVDREHLAVHPGGADRP